MLDGSMINQYSWLSQNDNFHDIAVLEWCKIYADTRGQHYWRRSISDVVTYQSGFLVRIELTEAELKDYKNHMRTCRYKLRSNLESEEVIHIQHTQAAVSSTMYLYDYLLENKETGGCFADS